MREHGVVRRVLLSIPGNTASFLDAGKACRPEWFGFDRDDTRFIEDYHEKLEEADLFPRFEKAGKLVDLVKVLMSSIKRADVTRMPSCSLRRRLPSPLPNRRRRLAEALRQFMRMYRPHVAREDRRFSPAFHLSYLLVNTMPWVKNSKIRKRNSWGGWDSKIVYQVAELEKKLGIYELLSLRRKCKTPRKGVGAT